MNEFEYCLNYLPIRIKKILMNYPEKNLISEIRLRQNSPITLTKVNTNVFVSDLGKECKIEDGISSANSEIVETVKRFCSQSLYRYMFTLSDGYIVNDMGFRLGICTNAKFDITKAMPEDFSSVSIRIPRDIENAADEIIRHFKEKSISSLLIISPPGEGKTTVIRDLARRLSTGEINKPMRTCVIDERREIFPHSAKRGLCDVIYGYKKGRGIEIATRIFNPEIIFCDEISNEEDSKEICESFGRGIKFIATCHGDSLTSAKKKPYINNLISSGVFDEALILKTEFDGKRKTLFRFEKLG